MRRPFLLLIAVSISSLASACGISLDVDPRPPTGPFDATLADGGASDAGAPGDASRPDGAAADAANVADAGPGCTDSDGDGYGTGGDCVGLDCDDANVAVTDTSERRCGGGACGMGFQRCVAGVWATTCTGDLAPSPEICNGLDDDCDGAIDDVPWRIPCGSGVCAGELDCTSTCAYAPIVAGEVCDNRLDDNCNGMVDEGCPAACVWVSPMGVAVSPTPTNPLTPLRSIQAAIDAAAADRALPRRVCVMGHGGCTAPVAVYSESLTMADGISVQGGFTLATAGSPTTRSCNRNVIVRGTTGEAVLFEDITLPTAISGLIVERNATADPAAGIVVRRSLHVVVNDVVVRSVPTMAVSGNTFGVWLVEGSAATVTQSRIEAGDGTTEAIGIKVQQSTARVIDNCQAFDAAGVCTGCDRSAVTNRGIFGRAAPAGAATVAYGVWLEDAQGTVVDQTGLCPGAAVDSSIIEVHGMSDRVAVTRNFITQWGANVGTGVHFGDCAGGAPLLAANHIQAQSMTYAYGVDVEGGCNPIIANNPAILTGVEGQPGTGVRCQGGSACVIEGNTITSGPSGAFHPTTSFGIECDGGCARVSRNVVRTVRGGLQRGLVVTQAGPIVAANQFLGGCATVAGDVIFGVKLDRSFARLENNVIQAEDCTGGGAPAAGTVHWGLVVEWEGLEENDVNANTIVGTSTASGCEAYTLALGALVPGAPGGGVFRNNLLVGGGCGGATIVREADADADPRIFENQFFHRVGSVSAIYDDEASIALTRATDVDALATGTGNREGSAGFCGYPANLSVNIASPCAGRGTPTGAPPTDRLGHPRPMPPTIGAHEPGCG